MSLTGPLDGVIHRSIRSRALWEWVKYSLWKNNNLYEGYEAEYQQSTGNIASKTIVHLLGILHKKREEIRNNRSRLFHTWLIFKIKSFSNNEASQF